MVPRPNQYSGMTARSVCNRMLTDCTLPESCYFCPTNSVVSTVFATRHAGAGNTSILTTINEQTGPRRPVRQAPTSPPCIPGDTPNKLSTFAEVRRFDSRLSSPSLFNVDISAFTRFDNGRESTTRSNYGRNMQRAIRSTHVRRGSDSVPSHRTRRRPKFKVRRLVISVWATNIVSRKLSDRTIAGERRNEVVHYAR